MSVRPTYLCILDGLGLNPKTEGNAVASATIPCIDDLLKNSPSSTLTTFGEAVGLPEGQMGNSEVGHLNIGAGRVVEQWLVRIKNGLQNGQAFNSVVYRNFINQTAASKSVHLIGLFSDGGVHSHIGHLKLLLPQLRKDFQGEILLHLITDGRDTSPTSGSTYLESFSEWLESIDNCRIATVTGRFFAMDRDNRWERTESAVNIVAHGTGQDVESFSQYLQECYSNGTTDEFIEPSCINYQGIQEGDGVLFWNFRADRMRQLVSALCLSEFPEFARDFPLFGSERTLLFTQYDSEYNLPCLFEPTEMKRYLGEVVANGELRQLRAAETEKYPHVTYFLNGGQETKLPGEERILVPSPRDVKTYDLKPEMSAHALIEAVLKRLSEGGISFLALNFANADMVGHTGNLAAATKAVETVDCCLKKLLEHAKSCGAAVVVIADHGNAEQMLDYQTGKPHTAHTTYPVPVAVFNAPEVKSLRSDGALCDVAPTVLDLMGLKKPDEMTGRSLLVR
jgi:2,3-bisphosphoglycerate-independent phosphoglycerate mutase